MIIAWEAVGPVPQIDEGTELNVRLVTIDSTQAALGRNIVGIAAYDEDTQKDQQLLDAIRHRIASRCGHFIVTKS